jgi:uroporphyrinogen-III decarboxylase
MTPRERYMAVLRGERPDILPRLPILMQFAAEHIGSYYGAFASDHRVLVEANLRCAEEFGIDQLNTMSDPYRETAGFGAPIEFPRNGVPICLKPPLESVPDLAGLPRPDPATAPRMRDRIDAVRAYKAQAGERYSIMGWVEGPAAEAADLRGVSNFFMDLLDDPDYAGALMARCVETAVEFARQQVAKTYESLILPHERALVAAVHGMKARARLHICGNIRHLLPGIATLGLDIVDIDHLVSLAEARRVLGPRTVLAGNVDPVGCVMRGTPGAIAAAIRRCYAEAGDPFMVNAGCEIPAATPPGNLRALCEPMAPA